MSEVIENILKLLEDGETYCKDSICIRVSIQEHYVENIINFLKHFEFLEADEKMENIRLTQEFLDFLLKVK